MYINRGIYMNALFNAIKDRGNIALANDGRLLKKSFFGLIILACAFQPGEFGIIIRESMTDAYLQVSVFVGFTLFIFIGLDSLTKFDIASFLIKTKKFMFQLLLFLVLYQDVVVQLLLLHNIFKEE